MIFSELDWIFHIHGKNHHAYGGCQQAHFIQALRDIFPQLIKEGKWDGTKAAKAYVKKAWTLASCISKASS